MESFYIWKRFRDREQFARQKDLKPKSVLVIFLDEALNDRTVLGFNTKAV